VKSIFSAYWLRSSVVSVLISLISGSEASCFTSRLNLFLVGGQSASLSAACCGQPLVADRLHTARLVEFFKRSIPHPPSIKDKKLPQREMVSFGPPAKENGVFWFPPPPTIILLFCVSCWFWLLQEHTMSIWRENDRSLSIALLIPFSLQRFSSVSCKRNKLQPIFFGRCHRALLQPSEHCRSMLESESTRIS